MTETATKKKTAKKTDEAPKTNKKLKQETYTAHSGNKYLFTFQGTFAVQRDVMQASNLPSGARSELLYSQNLMDNVLEGNEYTWDFFDKLIPAAKKKDTYEYVDDDGNKTKYHFVWPGLDKVYQMAEISRDYTGNVSQTDYFTQLMDNVISEDVDWDYWDAHNGYYEVMMAAYAFVTDIDSTSEFAEVMNAADEFIGKMFR